MRRYFSLFVLTGYLLSAIVFLSMAQEQYSISSRIVAWIIFLVGTAPTIRWLARSSLDGFPILELVLLGYVSAFSLPVLFQHSQEFHLLNLRPAELPVTEALSLALLGMILFYVGGSMAPKILGALRVPVLSCRCRNSRLVVYGFTLIAVTLLTWTLDLGALKGFLTLLISRDLAIAILAILYYRGELARSGRFFALGSIFLLVVVGLSTSLTRAILEPLLVWYLCRWMVTGKAELKYVLAGIFCLVLFQPVKLEYRNTVWAYQQELSVTESAELLSVIFYRLWLQDPANAFSDSTTSRTSLLLQTAHVLNWTPSVVPYRNGDTLTSVFTSWVPRAVWSEKPSAQAANIHFALDYGVTTYEGSLISMFGVGHIGESIMNFGQVFVGPIFFILGILSGSAPYLLNLPRDIISQLRSKDSSPDLSTPALSVAAFMQIFYIEGTITESYGGLLNLIVIQGFVLHVLGRLKISA